MPAPLDPVIAQIIPLLPLARSRDHDAAKRPRCAARAGRFPRGRAAAAGRQRAGHQGQGRAPARSNARVYRIGKGKAPTVVFFHGGGWVAGDLETHDRQGRWLAIETGAVVVSVDYRRPPETRFPGAFEDAFAAVRDVSERIGEFGGDASAWASPATAPAAISPRHRRSPAAMPGSISPRSSSSIP